MVSIYEPQDLIERTALQSMLESEGITVHVRDEPKARISILVPEEQAKKARELIEKYLGSLPPDAASETAGEPIQNSLNSKVWFYAVIILTPFLLAWVFILVVNIRK